MHLYVCDITLEHYSAVRKKEILPFPTTGLDLEGIVPSEMSQKVKDKYCKLLLTRGIRKDKLKIKSRMVGT